MANTSGDINLQSKQNIICQRIIYLADVIPFLAYVIFPSNQTLR